MKVLVATRNTQGQRGNDFCFVPEGEIVAFPAAECTGEKIDGSCGCRRSMEGIKSHKATTTVMVADNPRLSLFDLVEKILSYRKAIGFKVSEGGAQLLAEDLWDIAQRHEVGTVLERRGKRFVVRNSKAGATAGDGLDEDEIVDRMPDGI